MARPGCHPAEPRVEVVWRTRRRRALSCDLGEGCTGSWIGRGRQNEGLHRHPDTTSFASAPEAKVDGPAERVGGPGDGVADGQRGRRPNQPLPKETEFPNVSISW
jgi:hypothetical protein